MRFGKRFQQAKGDVAKGEKRLSTKRGVLGLALAALLVAMMAGGSIARSSPVAAAVPGWGSKTCIAYCEVNGWLEELGFSRSEHAQAHNPQASASCPLTPSIRDAEPPRP
ncbi:MAG: hypothetical protein HY665_09605 [Chloroflexi bacterium]|nr:hypothetical protein [Chloroflexota bacterium]